MTKIRIEGPGGTMCYEVDLIVAVLEKAGIKVQINDDHPGISSAGKSIEELIQEQAEYVEGFKEYPNLAHLDHAREVVINVVHQPWGG